MAQCDQTKVSGLSNNDSTLFNQISSLLQQITDLKTLRKIVSVTSDIINVNTFPQSAAPSNERLDSLFQYIPSPLTPQRPYNTRSVAQNSSSDDEFLSQLRLELDSMNLFCPESSKVKTKWLLENNVSHSHSDLRAAEEISKFPYISQLKERLNALPSCKGTLSGCIVNCYATGSARLRPHSDDEPYIDQSTSICTFSLGDTRDFGIFTKSHKNPRQLKTFSLESGSVFLMQPGSQAATKHKVLASGLGSTSSGVRYSISFRGIVPSTIVDTDTVNPSSSPSSDGSQSPPEPTETTLIFGSSIPKRMDAKRLSGRSGRAVINLAQGGAKIIDVMKHMDSFFAGDHEYFSSDGALSINQISIKNVIISVGTNDILSSSRNVNRFFIPIQNLLRKAKLLFGCDVYFQSVIPIPSQPSHVANSVSIFNNLVMKACRAEHCFYMNVFNKFLECSSFDRFFSVKRNGDCDIHPNRRGQSIIAKSYISIVRDHFNPFSRN